MPKKKNNFIPLGSFIVAKPFSKKETEDIEARKTNIKMPEASEKKGRVVWARVVAVGPGKLLDTRGFNDNGGFTGSVAYSPLTIAVGDIILLSEYDSYEIRVEGEEYLTIKEEFVFTKFEK